MYKDSKMEREIRESKEERGGRRDGDGPREHIFQTVYKVSGKRVVLGGWIKW